MTRLQMLAIFKRHRGELSRLAERAGVKLSTLNKWFTAPFTSANIEAKAYARVRELLEIEKAARLASLERDRSLSELLHVNAPSAPTQG